MKHGEWRLTYESGGVGCLIHSHPHILTLGLESSYIRPLQGAQLVSGPKTNGNA